MDASSGPTRPWEQRDNEPADAYARFGIYLELGPRRSLAEAAKPCGVSRARLKQLSARWRWAARAVAWDRQQALERRGAELRACQQARERIIRESADWQRLARLEIGSWVCHDEEGQPHLVRELTPSEAIRLWRLGCETELEMRGLLKASAQSPSSDDDRERILQRFREAEDQVVSCLMSLGVQFGDRHKLFPAVRGLFRSWLHWHPTSHPELTFAEAASMHLPWEHPLRDA